MPPFPPRPPARHRRARTGLRPGRSIAFASSSKLVVFVFVAFALVGHSPIFAAEPVSGQVPDPVNVNSASPEQLSASLKGVGPVKAAAIVAWREAHGPFDSVDALEDVPGIGPKTLERLRPSITVGRALAGRAAAREADTRAAIARILVRVHDDARRAAAGSP